MNGYILVSRAWYGRLSEVPVFSPSQKEKLRKPVSDSTLLSAIRITQLDEAFGALTMQRLLNRWPFSENMRSEDPNPTNDIEKVASLFVNGKLRWNEAHYEMADVYLRKKETGLAVQEYEAVNAMYPEDPFPLVRMGELYALLNQNEKAEAAFTQSLALSENQITHLKLGVLYLRAKQPDRAIPHLARSLELDPKSSVRLSRSQYEEATFYHALSLFQTGRFDEAQQSLSILIQINPANEKATRLLREVQLSKESQVKR
jgi:tetratricopeptide (TPR) repeat protein